MFKILPATVEDIPLIRQLTFKVWPQTYGSIISAEQIGYMLDQMYRTDVLKKQMTEDAICFILVYDDDEPVGFAAFGLTEHTTYKLHKIYVLQSCQGKGVGKYVINHILEEIQELGGERLQLQVNRHNKARDFYEKLGFSVISELDLDIGNGFYMNDYIMEKGIERKLNSSTRAGN